MIGDLAGAEQGGGALRVAVRRTCVIGDLLAGAEQGRGALDAHAAVALLGEAAAAAGVGGALQVAGRRLLLAVAGQPPQSPAVRLGCRHCQPQTGQGHSASTIWPIPGQISKARKPHHL